MANAHILFDPPSDAAAIYGGNWQQNLPLNNLKTPLPSELARSVDATASATTFTADLLFIRPLSMFAFIATNLSTAATIRIRVVETAESSSPALDVTFSAFASNVPWGALPWGAFPWDGYRPDYQPGGAINFYRHSSTIFGRYVRVDIADAGNPAGFVQMGRAMFGDPFVPRINMAYGAALRFIDESAKSRSKGGQTFWDKTPKRRQMSLQFPFLSEGEAMGAAYDLQSRLGLTGNLLLVYDPSDTTTILPRRTIYGSLAQLDDIVTANASVDAPYSWNLSVEELI